MNVVFMGTPDYAVRILRHLKEAGINIKAVFTQPDKPVGRGLKLQPNIIKSQALELGIPVEDIQTPNRINPEKSIE
mgnify:CR=1 FL=1